MVNHTPGPWGYVTGIGGDDGGFIIRLGTPNTELSREIWYETALYPDDDEYEEAHANARLIAAAPDLLDALETVTAVYINVRSAQGFSPESTPSVVMAVAAIAKARGEA